MTELVENRIVLSGYIHIDKISETENDSWMYKGRLFFNPNLVGNNFNLTAWGETALLLSEVVDRTNITIVGHISVSEYTSKCLSCGNSIKRNWVDVTVASFRILK